LKLWSRKTFGKLACFSHFLWCWR